MNKMKSALEIALERSQGLDGNIKKELQETEQQKYLNAARVLGRSFLQGKNMKETIKESIARYPEANREPALNTFLDEITSKMNLANTPQILQAITFFRDDPKTRQACAEVEKLYQQYIFKINEKTAGLQENIGKTMLKRLNKEGIKGTALAGFNVIHLDQWKEAAAQLMEEYKTILQNFRAGIINP